MSNMENPISHPQLQVRQLSTQRGYKTLFSDLNFELNAGQCLLIEGKNGVGKTTLLKILAGLKLPEQGVVSWQGQDIVKLGDTYRENMAWLGHDNALKPSLSAWENLYWLASMQQRSQADIHQVLCDYGLQGHIHQPVHAFSAGMKRRLALARLVLQSAALWLLDEPQASLDREGVALLEHCLQQHLQQGGLAVLSSHHDLVLSSHQLLRLRLD